MEENKTAVTSDYDQERKRKAALKEILEKNVKDMTGKELRAVMTSALLKQGIDQQQKLRQTITAGVWRGILIAGLISGVIALIIWFFAALIGGGL
ncbi:MAG: hypothetical protein FWH26_00405 [Oscillospiraceae bacterium]|nr:hypothetical protein [Oscillospiraceae bacterium]